MRRTIGASGLGEAVHRLRSARILELMDVPAPEEARTAKGEELVIRTIAAGDIPLIEGSMPRRMPGTHQECLEQQERGEALYLIAWLDDVPVAHLLLKWPGANAAIPDSPTLSDISVHPEHRSRGIGSRLMDRAERLAAERGYRQVGLSVALENVRARALYERRGYRDSGLGTRCSRWPSLDERGQERWHEETCVRLVKSLVEQAT